jgi:hypothetical protein
MTTSVQQLQGIIRYELLMHWRRRSLPAIIVFFLIALIGFSMISFNNEQTTSGVIRVNSVEGGVEVVQIDPATGETVTATYSEEQAGMFPRWMRDLDLVQVQNTLKLAFMIGIAMQALLVALMPMLAETIPLDKQVKVRELLDTVPLPRAVYLGGKVLAVWIGLLIGLALVGGVFVLFCSWRYGSFDLALYTRLWIALVFPNALIAAGFSILLNALMPSRRTAVLLGIALIPVAILMFSTIGVTLFINMTRVFDPTGGVGQASYDATMNYFVGEMVNGMLPFALALAAVWVMMWGLLRMQQAK